MSQPAVIQPSSTLQPSKSYNISATAEASNFKIGTLLGFAKAITIQALADRM